ncbi:MAG: imidazole glycerol phosphate synthase subunit HisH, partial [bacterium]
MKTLILDYGMGNIRSVQKACEFLGFPAKVGTDLATADRLIIPGVGAFGQAMANLRPFVQDIKTFEGPL